MFIHVKKPDTEQSLPIEDDWQRVFLKHAQRHLTSTDKTSPSVWSPTTPLSNR